MESVPNIILTPEKFQLVPGANEDCTLELTNVGYDPVMYRLLSTAPLRYVVRHTRGVVRGNSSAKISIMLNRKEKLCSDEQESAGLAYLKDDFRLEYATLGDKDVVDSRCHNVPQLIKSRKEANPTAVFKKMIRCHVLLNASAAAATRGGAAAGAAALDGSKSNSAEQRIGEAASADGTVGRRGMTAKEMEQTTLEEKKRRNDGGAVNRQSGSSSGGSGSGSSVKGKDYHSKEGVWRVAMVVAAIVAVIGMWLLME